MRGPSIYAEFPSSDIAMRVLDLLSPLPISKLQELANKKVLRVLEPDGIIRLPLTHRNLKWQHLDDYAKASDIPVQYMIFGDKCPNLSYSYYDDELFRLISICPTVYLKTAVQALRWAFYNPKMDIGNISPSGKIVSLALLEGQLPELVPEEEAKTYTTNINEALLYYRKTRVKERCIFHIDTIADLCSFYHVSPHWAFSLRTPLFTKAEEADEFIDFFCLLSEEQQRSALEMLWKIVQQEGLL